MEMKAAIEKSRKN
jgi:hypothetical protein